VAGTALAVGSSAGAIRGGIETLQDLAKGRVQSAAIHVALIVIPEEVNESLRGAKLLIAEEKSVLQMVNEVVFSSAGEAIDDK
jgi:hypothetical protein